MRLMAVVLAVLLWAVPCPAEKLWQDAKVVDITEGTSSAIVGVPLTTGAVVVGGFAKTYYRIETETHVYVLVYDHGRSWRAPNLKTIGRETRIALDGKNAFVLDDKGKEVKLPVARIIIKPPSQPAQPNEEHQ